MSCPSVTFGHNPVIQTSWDQRYSDELTHFCESGLEGEVWYVSCPTPIRSPTPSSVRFGEEPVENMVAWASTHIPPTTRPHVLDIGTGNGHLLFALVEAGYDASRLTGIDYSQGSVDLSAAIAKQRDEDEAPAYTDITFAVCDFLDPESSIPPPGNEGTGDGVWDLILDKGTYDAMSLMNKDEQGTLPLEGYVPRVVRLLRPGGHFLITCE